jgi:hypothetical protein
MRQLIAGRRHVAGPVHGFDDEGVYTVGRGVDEVLVHPGRDGQGTQHTVDVDLIRYPRS